MKLNLSAPARHWNWRWKACRSAAGALAADLADVAGAVDAAAPAGPTPWPGAVDLVTSAAPTRSPDAEHQSALAAADAGCLAARVLRFRRRMPRKFRRTGRLATLTFA